MHKIKDRTTDIKEFKGTSKENAISWIRVQGTNIDLPVVYYYDSDVSDATYDIAWSFVNDKKIADKTTIFSHNILNVSKKPQVTNKNHKPDRDCGRVFFCLVLVAIAKRKNKISKKCNKFSSIMKAASMV